MDQQTPFSRWERLIVRYLGIPLLRWPTSKLAIGEAGTVAHFCTVCRSECRDDLLDPLSRAERIICGSCGAVYHSRSVVCGFSIFWIRARFEHRRRCRMLACWCARECVRSLDHSKHERRYLLAREARRAYRRYGGIYSADGLADRNGMTFQDLETSYGAVYLMSAVLGSDFLQSAD